jgi:hypothetical protein
VLIAVVLLGTIPVAMATNVFDQLPQTTRNLNYEGAYEAAQGGLNDYLQLLDANESYGLYCEGCDNGDAGNAAFSGWVQLSSSPLEYYTYAPTDTDGVISLQVSGKAGSGDTAIVRTFQYTIKPATTLDDVYWSNYETIDPDLGSSYQYCATHYDEPSSDSYTNWASDGIPQYGPPSSCPVVFTTGDVLNGPVFSNDTFAMCGTPTFTSSVDSGNIYNTTSGTGGIYVGTSGCGSDTPTFSGPAPAKVGNETPRTASDDLTPARDYGCFITGGTAPTSLTPSNVTISLTVSGSTTKIAWSGSSAHVDNASTNTNSCTSPITLSSLTTGLVFVNGNVTISGQMTGALDVVTCNTSTDANTGNCNNTTTNSNIIIPSSITYPTANKVLSSSQPTSDSKDILGLIANNFVEVTATSTIEIDAAILALQDSFYVNNWGGGGSYGTLNVFGSIAQNFRGPVGLVGGTGYSKNYNFDTSLQTLFPPFFIPPNGATWSPTSYEECEAGLANSVQNTTVC